MALETQYSSATVVVNVDLVPSSGRFSFSPPRTTSPPSHYALSRMSATVRGGIIGLKRRCVLNRERYSASSQLRPVSEPVPTSDRMSLMSIQDANRDQLSLACHPSLRTITFSSSYNEPLDLANLLENPRLPSPAPCFAKSHRAYPGLHLILGLLVLT